jgi:RNA polymerase sigma factor (sigma-70 family)
MSSDERLAQRAAAGDQAAFEQIYVRYHQDLYRFCLAMVGNPPDAQDALQNTMIKVLRSLPGEKRQIKLKPWLYRIARNEAVEILRRRRESTELEPEQMPVAALTETAETRERLRTLLADLEQLPERQRAALVMRELSGLDFDQIGTAFGSSAAVARQTLYEARLSLRQLDAGREMRCAEVMQELSNADGRVTRRREIQAHLRTCADCRAFQDDIAKRHEDLAALAPLPVAASAGLLKGVLGSGASASAAAGGLGGGVGAGAGKAIATSALVKGAATVAVVAVVGASAADRAGLIDLPVLGRGGEAASSSVVGDSETPPGLDGGLSEQGGSAGSAGAPGGKASRSDGEGGGAGAEPAANRTRHTGTHGTSRSDQGANPPGGGYGRSASQRRGRPDSPPDASEKGRQTAGAHRPEGARAPTSPGSANGQGQGQGDAQAPAAKPPTPPKAESAPTPTEPGPPSEADSGSENGASQHGTRGATSESEG